MRMASPKGEVDMCGLTQYYVVYTLASKDMSAVLSIAAETEGDFLFRDRRTKLDVPDTHPHTPTFTHLHTYTPTHSTRTRTSEISTPIFTMVRSVQSSAWIISICPKLIPTHEIEKIALREKEITQFLLLF